MNNIQRTFTLEANGTVKVCEMVEASLAKDGLVSDMQTQVENINKQVASLQSQISALVAQKTQLEADIQTVN
jgi:peptidoglycan hydrolase CwlO-like protein